MCSAIFNQSWDRTRFCRTPRPGPFYLPVSPVRSGGTVMNEDKTSTALEDSPPGRHADSSPGGTRHEVPAPLRLRTDSCRWEPPGGRESPCLGSRGAGRKAQRLAFQKEQTPSRGGCWHQRAFLSERAAQANAHGRDNECCSRTVRIPTWLECVLCFPSAQCLACADHFWCPPVLSPLLSRSGGKGRGCSQALGAQDMPSFSPVLATCSGPCAPPPWPSQTQ